MTPKSGTVIWCRDVLEATAQIRRSHKYNPNLALEFAIAQHCRRSDPPAKVQPATRRVWGNQYTSARRKRRAVASTR